MSESLVMVDSSKAEESRKSQEMWRFFGDKPITLTELLESSPEAQQLKKFKFNCGSDKRWGQSFSTSSNSNNSRRKSSLPSFPVTLNFPSSSSSVNLESSKLSLLNSSGPIEPSETVGKRKLKKIKKDEREKTKGPEWFNLPAAEMNQDRKNDLDALQFRAALDTKRFYKRNSLPTRPKYFQVGRIVDNPADFFHSRVPRKQRKKTIAEEMVAEVSSTVSHL